LCFCLSQSWTMDAPTFTSRVAGITGMYHYALLAKVLDPGPRMV
jgi:hypothetical protein